MNLGEHVLYSTTEGVARITMNRPKVLNALSKEMFGHLTRAFRKASRDPSVDFIVITGAGKAFSAGLDIVQVGGFATRTEARRFVYRLVKPFWDIFLLECRKPIVAIVNGPAYGAGAEIALFSDLVISSPRATFAFSGGRVGALCCVSGFIGPLTFDGRRVLEMNLTGEPVPATEALRLGLVNHLVAEQDLEGKLVDVISAMRQTSPESNASLKRIRTSLIPRKSFQTAYIELYRTLTSQNFQKGSKAFIEKTRANYYEYARTRADG